MPSVHLEQLYDEHAQALFAFLLQFTRNEADTRDLLQQVFVKLANNPTLLENVRDPRAFLIRLSQNLAIDSLRGRGSRDRNHEQFGADLSIFARSTDPDEHSFRSELTQAMAELPEEQRTVVHLKLWEGLTFEKIAEILEITSNTAASRYRYGLDKLRTRLRPLYDEIR